MSIPSGHSPGNYDPLSPHDGEHIHLSSINDSTKAVRRSTNDAPAINQHKSAELTRTLTAQDWTGPDDPENPRNWPFGKKVFHTIVPALLAFVVSIGSSIYTPAYPLVSKEFGVGTTAALLPFSLYVLGLAFGPIVGASLSETFGRRFVYMLAILIFAFFIMGAGFSPNFGCLVVLRFLAGLFGSPPLTIGAGTNADLWPAETRARTTSFYVLSPFLGPAVGPIVGGYVSVIKGWRWTQWVTLMFTAVGWVPVLFTKETYKNAILHQRAKRLGIAAPPAGPRGLTMGRQMLFTFLMRPAHMLFTEPIVGFLALYISFNLAVLYSFFASLPTVFSGVYGFTAEQSSLVFIALAIGCVLGLITIIVVDTYVYQRMFQAALIDGRHGIVAPEHRLYCAMLGSIGLPVGLFWFAWTARSDIHWICPVIAIVPFSWGNMSIFISSALYIVDTYQARYGASAMAANGILRYIFGAAFPLFTLPMYNKLGIGWATSLLGFIAATLTPVPWVLFRKGSAIRAKSKYETLKA
ncbi:Polyamine transporter [Lachnellula suecica]|uniref:Polyamine transporter n=1 Tax=Lachnellula suecica TaxID=602035 RepID=A0A8T9CEI8_9HELO|nr:Polyamine transporter [Lachnellula suecica]